LYLLYPGFCTFHLKYLVVDNGRIKIKAVGGRVETAPKAWSRGALGAEGSNRVKG